MSVVLAVVACLAIAVVVGRSGSRPDVTTADHLFAERYLEPLRVAGVPFEVDRTCHYPTLVDDEPRHLDVQVTIGADPTTTASILRSTIEVVKGPTIDGSWILQDLYNLPSEGWSTGLRGDELGRTRLSAVFNNVEADRDANVGWQGVCEDGPRPAPQIPG